MERSGRRATVLAHTDEALIRRCMSLLGSLGDLGGAAEASHHFERKFEEDLGFPHSRETVDPFEEIQARHAAGPPRL